MGVRRRPSRGCELVRDRRDECARDRRGGACNSRWSGGSALPGTDRVGAHTGSPRAGNEQSRGTRRNPGPGKRGGRRLYGAGRAEGLSIPAGTRARARCRGGTVDRHASGGRDAAGGGAALSGTRRAAGRRRDGVVSERTGVPGGDRALPGRVAPLGGKQSRMGARVAGRHGERGAAAPDPRGTTRVVRRGVRAGKAVDGLGSSRRRCWGTASASTWPRP